MVTTANTITNVMSVFSSGNGIFALPLLKFKLSLYFSNNMNIENKKNAAAVNCEARAIPNIAAATAMNIISRLLPFFEL